MGNKSKRRRAPDKCSHGATHKDGVHYERQVQRQCGECEVCCQAIGVKELGKAAGEPCILQGSVLTVTSGETKTGCTTYDKRPAECRKFRCFWLYGWGLDGIPTRSLRPDRSGVILWTKADTIWGKMPVAVPAWPGSFRRQLAGYILNRLGQLTAYIRMMPEETRLVGPKGKIDEAKRRMEEIEARVRVPFEKLKPYVAKGGATCGTEKGNSQNGNQGATKHPGGAKETGIPADPSSRDSSIRNPRI